MTRSALGLAVLAVLALPACSQPIYLHTYDNDTMGFPNDFPNDKPTMLAFLTADERPCDEVIKPLRSLASRPEVYVVGVITYRDNSYLEQISTKREIVFPMMLDPNRQMMDRFGIRRFPTFVYLNANGKEIAREYDIKKVTPWYKSIWIDRALGRRHIEVPEDKVKE